MLLVFNYFAHILQQRWLGYLQRCQDRKWLRLLQCSVVSVGVDHTALHRSELELNSCMQELKNRLGDQFMLVQTKIKQKKPELQVLQFNKEYISFCPVLSAFYRKTCHRLPSQDSHMHTNQKHAFLQCLITQPFETYHF